MTIVFSYPSHTLPRTINPDSASASEMLPKNVTLRFIKKSVVEILLQKVVVHIINQTIKQDQFHLLSTDTELTLLSFLIAARRNPRARDPALVRVRSALLF